MQVGVHSSKPSLWSSKNSSDLVLSIWFHFTSIWLGATYLTLFCLSFLIFTANYSKHIFLCCFQTVNHIIHHCLKMTKLKSHRLWFGENSEGSLIQLSYFKYEITKLQKTYQIVGRHCPSQNYSLCTKTYKGLDFSLLPALWLSPDQMCEETEENKEEAWVPWSGKEVMW